mgnify:FL=1
MGILADNYRNHNVHQVVDSTLNYINKLKNETDLTDSQKDSLDAYELLVTYAKYVLDNCVTQTVPTQLLTNLEANIINLQSSNIKNIETTYNLYTAVMNDLSKIPVYNDKHITKAGIGKIIDNFNLSKEKIQNDISDEINKFQQSQKEETEKWKKEKDDFEKEISNLRKERDDLSLEINALSQRISSEDTRLTDIILKFQTDYDKKMGFIQEDFDRSQTDMKNEFKGFSEENKKKTDELYAYMQEKQKDVEKLWGIIGKASVSGSSQNYANRAKNFAHVMTSISLLIMIGVVVFLSYALYKDITSPMFNPINLLYRIPFGFTLFLPAWYCANIANKQRNREFQLRDFEIKTAGLEPFIENMRMVKCNEKSNEANKKDETKLELVKNIFQNDLDKKKVDDKNIIIPKDMLELLKSCLENWSKINGK